MKTAQDDMVTTNNRNIRNEIFKLRNICPHMVFVDFFIRKNEDFTISRNFQGHYRFYDVDQFKEIMLVSVFEEGEFVPTISDIFYNALWCEQEAHEMFGVNISHENRKTLLLPVSFDAGNISTRSGEGYPFITEEAEIDKNEIKIDGSFFSANSVEEKTSSNCYIKRSIGPFHNWHNGPVRLLFDTEKESIKRLQFEIGFGHKAIERKMEGKPVTGIPFYLERICFLSPQVSCFLYSNFIERCFNLTVPDKARAIRMSVIELSRIYSHLNMLRNLLSLNGVNEGVKLLKDDILALGQIFLGLTSNGHFGEFIVPGGVKNELPKRWASYCLDFCKSLQRHCEQVEYRLKNDRYWNSSLRHTRLDSNLAFRYGVLGPNIRSSGVNFDFRSRQDFYFYKEVDFLIPLGVEGNTFDRFYVRIEEIKQSIRIITQILDQLPEGQILHANFDSELESGMNRSFSASEDGNYRHNFRSIEDGPEGPMHLEIFMKSTLAPKKLGNICIERLRFLTNASAAAQVFPKTVLDTSFKTVLDSLASFNINFAEIDR